MRLKKDDTVIVIAGNEKGKEGKVKVIKGNKIVVQGVNLHKRHQKAQQGKKGTIVESEAAIDISNVAFSADGEAVKIRARITEEGKKELYYRTKNGTEKTIRTV